MNEQMEWMIRRRDNDCDSVEVFTVYNNRTSLVDWCGHWSICVFLSVIREKAGAAELGLKITAPQSRSSVPFNITATERGDHVTYVAKETGTYVIDVTYGRLSVAGASAAVLPFLACCC